jgi:hypothetical protein
MNPLTLYGTTISPWQTPISQYVAWYSLKNSSLGIGLLVSTSFKRLKINMLETWREMSNKTETVGSSIALKNEEKNHENMAIIV